jgi:hypothetical protein
MLSVCLCVCESAHINFLMFEPVFMKLDTYYHGYWAHLNDVLRKSLPSVCVSVRVSFLSLLGDDSVKCIPPFGIRQRLGKHVPPATNTRNDRRIIGRVIFYAIPILSKESLWVCLCIPLSLLGKNSVRTFPRQRRIVGGVVFYAACVVSKKSRQFVIPRTSCF